MSKYRKEKCEFCGRYGAQKHVEYKGPNGHGGLLTDTRYTCERCEERFHNDSRLAVANAGARVGGRPGRSQQDAERVFDSPETIS